MPTVRRLLLRDRVLVEAMLKAFDVLGEDHKRVVLFHLEDAMGLSFTRKEKPLVRVCDLQEVLNDMFEPRGAQFLFERVFTEMDRIAETV